MSFAEKYKEFRGFFITGTDTHVGKTFYSVHLLKKLQQLGFKTAAAKPIASGCIETAKGLQNEDALLLQQATSLALDYHQINPYALKSAITPHLAAAETGISLSAKSIYENCPILATHSADFIVVEGVGGWLVPLNESETMADFAKLLNLPVILVVGMRLGCLNHSLLTCKQIENSGLPFAGWVANCMDPNMLALEKNIETLQERINSPLLEVLK